MAAFPEDFGFINPINAIGCGETSMIRSAGRDRPLASARRFSVFGLLICAGLLAIADRAAAAPEVASPVPPPTARAPQGEAQARQAKEAKGSKTRTRKARRTSRLSRRPSRNPRARPKPSQTGIEIGGQGFQAGFAAKPSRKPAGQPGCPDARRWPCSSGRGSACSRRCLKTGLAAEARRAPRRPTMTASRSPYRRRPTRSSPRRRST